MSANSKTNHSTAQATNEAENDWLFDIIINFLRSPRWKHPIMSFLDENCIIFDTEDENKLEYTALHQKFKKLIEGLLEELMAELGVTSEQFLDACEKASENPIHKKIVDQITAVENFVAFKKLMVKRNSELNEYALNMMPGKNGGKTTEGAVQKQELVNTAEDEEMMKRAMELSMQIENQKKKELEEEDEMIRRAMEMSEQEERERLERIKKGQLDEIEQLRKKTEEQERKLKQQQDEIERISKLGMPPPEQVVIVKEVIKEDQPTFQVEMDDQAQNSMPKQESLPKKKKKKILKEKPSVVQEQPVVDKQPNQKMPGFDLPPVQMKRGTGAFDFDTDLLDEQRKQIARLQSQDQPDEFIDPTIKKNDNDGKSLKELMQEKREQNEKIIGSKQPVEQKESVEERKKRLQAQRDLIVKQKNEKREKELEEFNSKTKNKQDLHKELLEMDRKLKDKQLADGLEEDDESTESPDKRLAMYHRMRKALMNEEQKDKQNDQMKKMDELNKKIEALERAKKEKMEKQKLLEEEEEQKQQKKAQGVKSFLGNIKTFTVDDM